MKNVFIILFSLLVSNQAMSQDYESIFGTQSTQWNITFGNLWGFGTTEHNVVGDTTINNLTYKIVNGYDGPEEIIGYLRENASHSKVWYRNNYSPDEILIMDLDLDVGDSMFISGVWNSDHQYYYVDSVYVKDGRKHLRFDLEVHFLDNEKFTVIEGITSNLGFRYQDSDYINSFPTILLCSYKNGNQVYGTDECIISAIEEHSSEAIEIYPNPVRDALTIDYKGSRGVLFVTIYDLSGKNMLSAEINTSDNNVIDLKKLNAGFYLIHVRDKFGNLNHTARVMKSE